MTPEAQVQLIAAHPTPDVVYPAGAIPWYTHLTAKSYSATASAYRNPLT
jgi:hypothetical protein